MAPLVCCNCVRIKGSLWGRSSNFGHDSCKNKYGNIFLHFTSAADTDFTNNGRSGGGLFFMGLF